MSDIVERLRNISGQPGDQGDVVLCTDAAEEIERLRLTDAERDAISYYVDGVGGPAARVATLRGLLKRTTL